MKYFYYIAILVFIILHTTPIIAIDALDRYQKHHDECVSRIIESQYMTFVYPYSLDTLDFESYFGNYTNLLSRITFDGYPGDFLYDKYRFIRLMYHYSKYGIDENASEIISNAKKRVEEYSDKDDIVAPEHIARMLLLLAKTTDVSDNDVLKYCDRAEELCRENMIIKQRIALLKSIIYIKNNERKRARDLLEENMNINDISYNRIIYLLFQCISKNEMMPYLLNVLYIADPYSKLFIARKYDDLCIYANYNELHKYKEIIKHMPASIISICDKYTKKEMYLFNKTSAVHTELKVREIEQLEFTNSILQLRALIKDVPKDNKARVLLALGDLYADNNDLTNAVAQYYEITVSKTILATYCIACETMIRLHDHVDMLTEEQKKNVIESITSLANEYEDVPEYTQLMNSLMKK